MVRHYRYIVAGRGLMGSAAGKYLAEMSDGVALVGPNEPEGLWAGHPGVFASHYDEGRITRSIDPDAVWARLARQSISRYREIETQSNIGFYTEKGALLSGAPGANGAAYVVDAEAVASRLSLDVSVGGSEMLAERFGYFSFPDGSKGVFEPRDAGFISPRNLVRAQNAIAEKAGADILLATVTSVREQGNRAVVETSDGEVLTADKVLVAAGGFSIVRGLLPQPIEMTVFARTVVLFEVDEGEAERLSSMPSMIHVAEDAQDDIYMLPPIRYPDGKYYLKIGGDPVDVPLEDGAAVARWFREGASSKAAMHLEARMKALVPDLKVLSTVAKPCVTSFSSNGYPMIGWTASPHIAVLTAGCGASAKSSDEMGRLGAELLVNGLITTPGYDADFSAKFIGG